VEDSHVGDRNRDPGSKQADGSDGGDKAKRMQQDSMGGSGGRTGSGIGKAKSADVSPSDAGDMSAGSKNKSEETEEEEG
jgi:hypothetical protein